MEGGDVIDLPYLRLVSEATQNRYARAAFEFRRASDEYNAAWHAVIAEQYARSEATNPPDPSEDMG